MTSVFVCLGCLYLLILVFLCVICICILSVCFHNHQLFRSSTLLLLRKENQIMFFIRIHYDDCDTFLFISVAD